MLNFDFLLCVLSIVNLTFLSNFPSNHLLSLVVIDLGPFVEKNLEILELVVLKRIFSISLCIKISQKLIELVCREEFDD